MKNLSISFGGSLMGLGTAMGYGYAAVELIKAWQAQGVPVWWGKEECPVAFSFSQPEWYDWQRDDQYKIGYTPWESTELPKYWPVKMNMMDEIWTTSETCKEWFINEGITVPVRVLHHGLNASQYPQRRKLRTSEPYKFLHIGEPAPRKGGELVYNAFKNVFGDNTEVQLTLKGNPRFDVTGDNVQVIRDNLTREELNQLYYDHHAFLYPTNGEGFGFLPFDAMASGMPTLVTDWSGPKDFMEYGWPLKTNNLKPCNIEPHLGMWADPNIDDLELWMSYFVGSPNYFFDKAFRKAKKMSPKWSWENVAKLSLNWIEEGLAAKAQS